MQFISQRMSSVGILRRCARRCYVLAIGSLLIGLAQATPKEVLQTDEVRFVTANAEFTLLHEMGHLLISELKLPVLGREEDAADQLGFMGLFLLHQRQHDDDFYAKLIDIADYWRLEWQRQKPEQEEVREWDSHALDAQRFFNLACLAYGSDPQRLEWVIEVTGLPDERAFYCPEEYQQVEYAVNWIRQNFSRPPQESPRHRIRVRYEEPPSYLPGGAELLEKIQATGMLEAVADKASRTFDLPRDLNLTVTACGGPDAWYNRISGELALCYERIAHFRTLARELPRLRGQQPAAGPLNAPRD